MYACFSDASRAFDRVNHTKLLSKLKTAGVPTYILRVICYWYCNQTMCIRWGSVISDVFTVTNGVRQGGILSPLLFNFYMNDLSVLLSKIPAGCYSGNTVINHLMYADDLVVFAPSAKDLQKLLNICDDASGDKQILQLWKTHYMNIFNCVNKSNCSSTYDELQGNHILLSSDMVVHAQEIVDIISKLPSGKSPGPDEINF